MVFQRPTLLRRSVAANIRFALRQRYRKAPFSIDDILSEVGLEKHAKQPARLLSGGEQQRLNLARALSLQPKVLFLDEPTASLDPASTLAIERIVQRAHQQGTKIIFVSHDLGQARRLADDIVFLHEGSVVLPCRRLNNLYRGDNMIRNTFLKVASALTLTAGMLGGVAHAEGASIILQSTTSTANSGLYDAILPQFTEKTGITVHVVAVGTGQAIKNAQNGDGDVLLVHAKPAEEKFVAEGFGVERSDVMYNDFIIVGPEKDPAGVAGMTDAVAAMQKIAQSEATFASRGDNSGTHKKEMRLWKAAGIDQKAASGKWYRETGSGMGATLNTAVGMGAYALTDRGTWISFKNKANFKIVVEGDKNLFNQYGIMLVNPEKHPKVKAKEGQAFIDWILGEDGQSAIAAYQLDGQQLFFPNAAK
ncbi:unnamed protein product [Cyprideis torosa]|uniref:Uncharacterized protein n=1 Tax=Cyprideis torosa TaxID=163714 RepID=A0A7R8WUB5_9CRUS|nr:unnamed protein product [Cyprideis torosa]CAG0908974.1 unnamed protein product [Cyprideis torosa]